VLDAPDGDSPATIAWMLVRDAAAMLAGSGLDALGPMTWADLGCGDGTFTLALADLLAPRSVIHAIDRHRAALKHIAAHRRDVRIDTHLGDFVEPWPFGPVDGILMANSLHYVANQEAFVRSCESRMTSPRRVLIVEYDTSNANAWVPYPVSRSRLAELFSGYSFRSLGSRPSRYQRARLYAELMEAASVLPQPPEIHEFHR
jgi:trans-aconitate methyltransferase